MCVYGHIYALEWASVENFGVMCTTYTSVYLWGMSVTGCIKWQWGKKRRKATNRKKERTIEENANCHGHGAALSCTTNTLDWPSLLLLGDRNEQATCCTITDDNLSRKWEENFLTTQWNKDMRKHTDCDTKRRLTQALMHIYRGAEGECMSHSPLSLFASAFLLCMC